MSTKAILILCFTLLAGTVGVFFLQYKPVSLPEPSFVPVALEEQQKQTENARFQSDANNFAFEYPLNYAVSEREESEGRLFLLRSLEPVSGKFPEFQIYAVLFEDTGTITKERIEREIPDIVISQHKNILISGNAPGLSFVNEQEGFSTKEIWFTYKGRLYQISGAIEFDSIMEDMIQTWKFLD